MLGVSGQNFGCNLCGCDNCAFGDPQGVVNFIYDNKLEKRPCVLLQQQVENPTIYNRTYCQTEIWKKAFAVCSCFNTDTDVLLSDIPGEFCHSELLSFRPPVTHPASCRVRPLGYGDRPYGNPGTIDYISPNYTAPVAVPIQLQVNITNQNSFADESTLNSTREGLIIAPDGSFSEFITTVECESGNETEFREAMGCSCSVEVKDRAGQLQNCTCSVCMSGFGLNPVHIECQDDSLVAECSSMDCNFTCNGTCVSDCDSSEETCELCTSPPTISPTVGLADLLPECALSPTLDEIIPCIADYSDPECLTSAILSDLQLCLITTKTSQLPNLTKLIDLEFFNATAACFAPLGDCIMRKIVDAFAEIPACILESGLALAQCFIDNPMCASQCTATNWTSPFDTVSDTNVTSCSTVAAEIMDPMCDLVSCCTPCIDELESLAICAVNQSSSLSDCELKCTPSSEIRMLKGITDTVTTASATVIFSRCISGDLDLDNATMWFDLVDCIIDEILSLYYLSQRTPTVAPNTTSPTSLPTSTPTSLPTSTPTSTPTIAPSTLTPTSVPTTGLQEYTFTDLTMRLQGGKQLTAESRAAFQEATEEFYKSILGDASGARRRLQGEAFTRFETEVTATGENVDANGNTIFYEQYVGFISASFEIPEAQVKNLILAQLADDNKLQNYIQSLKQKDADFQSVTAVSTDPNSLQSNDNDDDEIIFGLSLLVVIIAAGGVIVCCCCVCVVIGCCVMNKRGGGVNKLNDDGEDAEKNGTDDYMAPQIDTFDGFGGQGDTFGGQGDGDTFADEFGVASEPFETGRSEGQVGEFDESGSGSGNSSGSESDDDESGSESSSGSGSGDDSGSDGSSEDTDRFA